MNSDGFIKVTNAMITSGALATAGPNAYIVWSVLAQFGWSRSSYPSYETLMTLTGIRSRTTIAATLQRLEQLGWIERSTANGKTTRYRVATPDEITSPKNGLVTEPEPVQKMDCTSPISGLDQSKIWTRSRIRKEDQKNTRRNVAIATAQHRSVTSTRSMRPTPGRGTEQKPRVHTNKRCVP